MINLQYTYIRSRIVSSIIVSDDSGNWHEAERRYIETGIRAEQHEQGKRNCMKLNRERETALLGNGKVHYLASENALPTLRLLQS